MTAMPHPDKPAVDAAAQGFLNIVADMRKIPLEQRPRLGDLDPVQRLTARNAALEVLTPAAPHVAVAAARALAAELDKAGEHSAATRIHAIAGSWVEATVPDDLSSLF